MIGYGESRFGIGIAVRRPADESQPAAHSVWEQAFGSGKAI